MKISIPYNNNTTRVFTSGQKLIVGETATLVLSQVPAILNDAVATIQINSTNVLPAFTGQDGNQDTGDITQVLTVVDGKAEVILSSEQTASLIANTNYQVIIFVAGYRTNSSGVVVAQTGGVLYHSITKIGTIAGSSVADPAQAFSLEFKTINGESILGDGDIVIESSTDISGLVPYTGASSALDLGSNNFTMSGQLRINTPSAPEKLGVLSTDTENSAVGFVGSESGKGTLKITHNKPLVSDANASGLSISLAGSGTEAQGIFIDAPSGTTGRLLRLRNSGSDRFVVDKDGILTQNLAVRSTGLNNDVALFTASDGSRLARLVETAGGHSWFELDNASGTATTLFRSDAGANYINAGDTGFGTTTPTSRIDILGTSGHQSLRVRTSYTPSNSADTNGQTGQIAWDDNYSYVKTSAGWKRTALSTF